MTILMDIAVIIWAKKAAHLVALDTNLLPHSAIHTKNTEKSNLTRKGKGNGEEKSEEINSMHTNMWNEW